ncbi:DMT family transporter [Limibaculum sp. M0105]|uniref:DMT family transporter n=1 Tax=Thermohalobaculum xanthum TaxID=2753746 RepID=A0A8J7SH69_9RHOB|nr:DMT family transporter [Thermohalobaculum xanthum]MBK0399500.1 DMT family transporter [Thermohalobaculum xanthum]
MDKGLRKAAPAGPGEASGWGTLGLIALIGVLWGLNWPAVKFILSEVEPWTLRAFALTTGTLCLAAIAALKGETLRPPPGTLPRLAAAGFFTVFGFNILTAFGQLVTETSKAAIIAFTMPVWASILSTIFLGERAGPRQVAAIGLGMAALGLLIAENPAGILAAPAGPLFMLAAALSWAVGTVLLKGAAPGIGPVARAAWIVGVAAVPATLGAMLVERPWDAALPSAGVLAVLAFHVAGPMVACHAAWATLVGRLPVAVSTVATLLIPVVGVLSSGLLLGEPLGPLRLLALAAVIGAVALAVRR